MKVLMKVSIAGEHFSYVPEQVVDLDEELARKWIEVGHAEPIEKEKPVEKAVRTAPENALSARGKAK